MTGNDPIKAAEGSALGVRVRDGIQAEREWAAFDRLPPILRQQLSESPFEWAAQTVLYALETVCRLQPAISRDEHARTIVLWLAGEDERVLAELQRQRADESL